MKRSRSIPLAALVLVGVCILMIRPVRTKVRGTLVRLWSKKMAVLKIGETILEDDYSWRLKDSEGNLHIFGEERGRVVFLNFWATWCAPCIKEMPDIQKLYDEYNSDVQFLLVTDENFVTIQSFLNKRNFTIPMYLTDKVDIPDTFFSRTIPTTYIFDHTGKIKMAKSGVIDIKNDSIRRIIDTLIKNASRQTNRVH